LSRVLVIGIDGMEPGLVERWWDEMPNLRRLRDEGAYRRMKSVYPPDSIPAWATIYTGLRPDNHGILDSVDYLDKRRQLKCDAAYLRGNTFWDTAGAQGKRVCIINPFLAYPVWPVNGIMANGPVFVTGEVQAFPDEIMLEGDLPEMGGIVDFPTKNTLPGFIDRTRELTMDLHRFACKTFRRERWDLFFVNYLTLDRVQHFFWRYFDEEDPTYPGKNRYSEVIPQFYRLFDSLVADYAQMMEDGDVLLVVSDHGHGMRCTKAFHLNEFLRQEGYLASKVTKGKLDPKYLVERAKQTALNIAHKYDMVDLAYRIGKLIPRAKELKKSTFIIDKEESLARTASFAGMNPSGGIEIDRDLCAQRELDCEQVRTSIIDRLAELKDIVEWAAPREELFQGRHADVYPEILFELKPEYGVSRTLYAPLVGVNPTHKKVSGGHKPDAALFVYGLGSESIRPEIDLTCIAPTLLDLLGVEARGRFDGASVIVRR